MQHLGNRASGVLTRLTNRLIRRRRKTLAGQFQPYNFTLPDRYPWLFRFAADEIASLGSVRLLSFGCSVGEEVLTLARYFPDATIKGIDIDPQNIERARAHVPAQYGRRVKFEEAGTTQSELCESFDAIFCLAVFCNGDLTNSRAARCDPTITFEAFDRHVTDFARCLKPGGLLLIHTSSFRFCDAAVSAGFKVVLRAQPSQLSADPLFDRRNIRLANARYYDVGFRKHP
jgi:SAM-dependent methyltransferase